MRAAEAGRTPCPKDSGQEELPHVRGQGQGPRVPAATVQKRPRGATPSLRSRAAPGGAIPHPRSGTSAVRNCYVFPNKFSVQCYFIKNLSMRNRSLTNSFFKFRVFVLFCFLVLRNFAIPKKYSCLSVFILLGGASQVVQWLKKKKNPPANTEDTGDRGFTPGLERCPGGVNGNPL